MIDIEATIQGICAEALERESIGPDENLVDAGVDSLLAVEIITRLHMEFGVDLLEEFFAQPTAANLAKAVRSKVAEAAA
jgi:acyl carrier protein